MVHRAPAEKRGKGRVSLAASFVLGVLAVGGAASALFVPERAVLIALSFAACVACAGLVAAFVSYGGGRIVPSTVAVLASLLILGGVGSVFAGVGMQRFARAVGPARAPRADPIVDRDYRFRLTPPDDETTAYDARTVRRLNSRAVAGLWLRDPGIRVFVFVELPYGRSLKEAAHEWFAFVSVGEPSSREEERVRFVGRDALRLRARIGQGEDAYFVESTFFLHQGHVYHLHASGPSTLARSPYFPIVLESFELLGGRVHDRFDPPLVARDDGAGWRVRDNLYENADFGLRVRGRDYELRYGSDAHQAALVSIEQRHPNAGLSLDPAWLAGLRADSLGAQLRSSFAERIPESGESHVHRVSGQEVMFTAHGPDAYGRHFRHGVWADETRLVVITTWAPTDALVERALHELSGRVAILDSRQTERLRDALDAAPDAWHEAGADHAIRGGVLRDFRYGVRWRRPDRSWRGERPRSASTSSEVRIASLSAPALGLCGAIFVRPDDVPPRPLASVHASLVAAYTDAPLEPVERSFGRARGFSTARIDPGAGAIMVGLASVRADDLLYRVEIWGARDDFDRHADAVRAALEGLELFEVSDPSTLRDGVYTDERMGYALRAPWENSSIGSEWNNLLDDEVGSLVELWRRNESIAVIAAPLDPTRTEREQGDELARMYGATLLDGPWRERRARLAGRAARMRVQHHAFGLGETRIYEVTDRGVLYVLVFTARRSDPDSMAAGFSLLD